MNKSLTDTVLMIKPIHFRGNEQTAINNYFQNFGTSIKPEDVQSLAVDEFNNMVHHLREVGVNVVVVLDNDDFDTPDSIFPNNWLSFHSGGVVGIYPMFAENRRNERREDIFDLLDLKGVNIREKIDLTQWESQSKFLEGTGSLVLDRINKIAYAALSPRTNREVLSDFERRMGYKSVTFSAFQTYEESRVPIYHTNVLMSMGDGYCVVCLDAIDDEVEKNELIVSLTTNGREIIPISEEQVSRFAGNMLQLKNNKNEKVLVMSESAWNSLDESQIDELNKHNDHIIHVPLTVIETLGGGSARCMIAEVFY